ncbi:hypothetical protein DLREEDagrD3_14670 [Denitratisoma sp. agr-D3]
MDRRLLLLPAVALLAACASEKVVLLPDRDGKVGRIEVRTRGGATELSQAYAVAEVSSSGPRTSQSDGEAVQRRYGAVLEGLPSRPRRIELNFEFGSDRLTAQSRALVPDILKMLKDFPAPEVVVIGHTDSVGDTAYNDKLSLDRAQRIRELLVGAGIPRDVIQVVGRGEREPLVTGRPGVPEPRNRRVEIKLR